MGVCPQTVNGLLWRFQQAGIIGLETQPGQGRRAILQVTEDAAAVRLAVTDHRQRIAQARAGQDTVRDTLMAMDAGLHNL